MDDKHIAGFHGAWIIGKDGQRVPLEAKTLTTFEARKPISIELPEFKWSWASATVDRAFMDSLFPQAKPQWILKLSDTDFNTLTDDQRRGVIGRQVVIKNHEDKVLYRLLIVGVHESGGLLTEYVEG